MVAVLVGVMVLSLHVTPRRHFPPAHPSGWRSYMFTAPRAARDATVGIAHCRLPYRACVPHGASLSSFSARFYRANA